jgi:Domain of unknown function (DUF4258)
MAIRLTDADLHDHLKARMAQRGIITEEVEQALNEGWEATDAKQGTLGKVKIFLYMRDWEGTFYKEKEVSVYYKMVEGVFVLLTVKARYGQGFPRRDMP